MALIEEFNSSGNWLFKRRSYLPLILFVLTAIALFFDKTKFANSNDLYYSLICLIISVFGLIIRVIAIGYSNKGTSGRNVKGQVAEALNTDGIYSLLRHPLYLGNYFMWMGIVLLTANIWLIISITLLFWIYYERIMFAEESFLRNKFGKDYINWASRTPALFPKFKNFIPAKNKFDFKDVIKREFYGVTAVAISMLFVNFLQNYFHNGELYISPFHKYFALIAVFLFIILRFLKKNTKILK